MSTNFTTRAVKVSGQALPGAIAPVMVDPARIGAMVRREHTVRVTGACPAVSHGMEAGVGIEPAYTALQAAA